MKFKLLIAAILATSASLACAAVDTYKIEPNHTYPSFEADHMGISVWRGKFTKTDGTITLDRAAKTGTVDITIDMNSVDFGHEKMNAHAKKPDIFDVAQYPTATFKGNKFRFEGENLVAVMGDFTLHGVTKPLTLNIAKFKCIQHPMLKREVCGADAHAIFQRSDFGINIGLPNFSPEVRLAIQVEAVKQ